jgi:hypothetical protein
MTLCDVTKTGPSELPANHAGYHSQYCLKKNAEGYYDNTSKNKKWGRGFCSPFLLGLIGCVDHVDVWNIFNLVAPIVDYNPTTSFALWNAVACSAKVQNL